MKDLIIITSVINISKNPFNYTKTRSVYSLEERYEQTLKTIKSCRLIPSSEIAFVETSKLSPEKEGEIKSFVSHYFNYQDNIDIKRVVDGAIKGAAEATQLSECLNSLNLNEYQNIYKISGRYWFSGSFDYQKFNNEDTVFLEGPNKDSLATVMYKINKKDFKTYKDTLDYCKKSGGMIEKDFIKFFKEKYSTYDKIGVEGHVSVDGNFIDC